MEEAAECMLVLIGATPERKKELVGFQTGVRESAQSWRELLIDIKQRGLEIAPDLAVGDGALGFWKAIEEIFPGTRHQRCWVHKTANVLNKVALSVQVNMKANLREVYAAPTRAAAEAAIDVFADKYGAKYQKAERRALGQETCGLTPLAKKSSRQYCELRRPLRSREAGSAGEPRGVSAEPTDRRVPRPPSTYPDRVP